MKLKTAFVSVCTILLCCTNFFVARAEEPVRGFLVDMSKVKMLTDRGASGIKIYAAMDDAGKPYYIMAGIDENEKRISGQVYRQNETGDCPPSCDFQPSALTSGGSFIEADDAKKLVDNYLEQQATVENAVVVCAYSINKVLEKDYNFMRVSFERKVKITGVKDDGGIRWFAPFTHSCNNMSRCTMEE